MVAGSAATQSVIRTMPGQASEGRSFNAQTAVSKSEAIDAGGWGGAAAAAAAAAAAEATVIAELLLPLSLSPLLPPPLPSPSLSISMARSY